MRVNPPLWLSPIAAAKSGPILYRTGSAGGERQFSWFDRSGKKLSDVGSPVSGMLSPSVSPDGQQVAIHRSVDGNTDIWLLDSVRGVLTRFTSGTASEFHPIWTLDGKNVVFNSGPSLVVKSLRGSDQPTQTPFTSEARALSA